MLQNAKHCVSHCNWLSGFCRPFSASSQFWKNIGAGRYKITPDRSKPMTYEQTKPPYLIGVSKGWNSWNTSNLDHGLRASETAVEDVFIRRFMKGTWPNLFVSEVVIKRRHNMIIVAGLVQRMLIPRRMYFLLGYSEEMLSFILKCPVQLEIQTVEHAKDVIFRYI